MFKRARKKDKVFSKKRRFDYARKKFENPFFKKHKKVTIGTSLKVKMIATVLLLIVGFSAWFFIYSPFWKIKSIEVLGLERLDKREIEKLAREEMRRKIAGLIPCSNSLFFSEKNLTDNITSKYHFEKITIKKNLPKALKIELEEKLFACTWQEDGETYYSDSHGYILEKTVLENVDRGKYPLIINRSSQRIKDRIASVDKKYIKFILDIFKIAEYSPIGFEIKSFVIDDEQETVKIESQEGPIIKFSTRNDAEDQLERLIVVRHEKLKNDFINKKYIDLRFGDKIYFQ